MTTEIYCTLQVEGTHCWPDCPLEEVVYLRSPHRHIFHIKAYAIVNHSDRDIEFIKLKHEITRYLSDKYYDRLGLRVHRFGSRSCEMIAEELIEQFGLSKCEVNEDNENGCIVTKD